MSSLNNVGFEEESELLWEKIIEKIKPFLTREDIVNMDLESFSALIKRLHSINEINEQLRKIESQFKKIYSHQKKTDSQVKKFNSNFREINNKLRKIENCLKILLETNRKLESIHKDTSKKLKNVKL